ncbi:DUF3551 domain-containing protein [Bradyrhizobium sp. 2TAF24]|uniref:DUF3551 domain-containing protein n=1 Tax=Bradyrhizobium sp. 2TAF24 TaxID=3233011 RepID=UPI003F8E07FB
MMRAVLAAAAFGLAFAAMPASAQSQIFPICLHWRDDLVSCRFVSLAQCNASASGIGATCLYNPAYPFGAHGVADPAADARDDGAPPPRRRHRARHRD